MESDDRSVGVSLPPTLYPPTYAAPRILPFPSCMSVATLKDSLGTSGLSKPRRHVHNYDASSDADSIATDPSLRQQLEKRVTFHAIEIREYQRTVSDNPSVSCGPPIGISWHYTDPSIRFSLDEYERDRPPRRASAEMQVPRFLREEILKESGMSSAQIRSAVKKVNLCKGRRKQTVVNLHAARMEEIVQAGFRRLGRLLRRTSKRHEQESLWIHAENIRRTSSLSGHDNDGGSSLNSGGGGNSSVFSGWTSRSGCSKGGGNNGHDFDDGDADSIITDFSLGALGTANGASAQRTMGANTLTPVKNQNVDNVNDAASSSSLVSKDNLLLDRKDLPPEELHEEKMQKAVIVGDDVQEDKVEVVNGSRLIGHDDDCDDDVAMSRKKDPPLPIIRLPPPCRVGPSSSS